MDCCYAFTMTMDEPIKAQLSNGRNILRTTMETMVILLSSSSRAKFILVWQSTLHTERLCNL